jgi:hypothetical protein
MPRSLEDFWRSGRDADIKIWKLFGVPNTYLEYTWTSIIHDHYKDDVLVGFVKTKPISKGLILVPVAFPPHDREFGGLHPIKVLDLPDWDDPVKDVLSSINLLPKQNLALVDHELIFHFDMRISASTMSTDIGHFTNDINDPTINRLWTALQIAIQDFAELYKDIEITHFTSLELDESWSSLCIHLDQIRDVSPKTDVCEECLRKGDHWVHLSVCKVCGYVGCSDLSKNKHAARHFIKTGHAIAQPLHRDDEAVWCYMHKQYLRLR